MFAMRRLALFLFFGFFLLCAAAAWLLGTQNGLQMSLAGLEKISAGRLQVQGAQGRWLGPLHIEEILWQESGARYQARQLVLAWQASALWRSVLDVATLEIGAIDIKTAPDDDTPFVMPEDLRLPLDVHLPAVRVGLLQIDALPAVHDLVAGVYGDEQGYRLENLSFSLDKTHIAASLHLANVAPFAVEADAQLRGVLAEDFLREQPLAAQLQARGTLAAIDLMLNATRGLRGQAEIRLTPFAAQPFAQAKIDLAELNPADWLHGAPQAALSVQADVQPVENSATAAKGLHGTFSIRNAQPGPFDQKRLPIAQCSGSLVWQETALAFPRLHLRLAGAAELSGQGRWQEDALKVELVARALDARGLWSTLEKTRLDGPLHAVLGADKQSLAMQLGDARFSLAAKLSHADGVIDIPRLHLASRGAGLSAEGRVGLAGQGEFALAAQLKNFDPRAFAQWPQARLNAQLKAHGQWREKPQLQAQFSLQDSHYRQAALAGNGRLHLRWPQVSAVDVDLSLGENRLTVRGALGRAQDRLHLTLAAPRLEDFGGQGAVQGDFELSGALDALRLRGELAAPRLAWPGRFAAQTLRLKADLPYGKTASEAALLLDFSLAKLDLQAQTAVAEQLVLQLNGTPAQHRLQLQTQIFGGDKLALQASGSLRQALTWDWQGVLTQLSLASPNAARQLRLLAPASLQISPARWQLTELQLGGETLDWRARLAAEMQGARAQLRLTAQGERLGALEADLAVGMENAWHLARHAPWQGALTWDTPDLSWLGEFLGEGWRTGGRLHSRLQLAGQPAAAQLRGTLAGEKLSFALPEMGLHLEKGILRAQLHGQSLRVDSLYFENPHRPLPRALKKALGEAASQYAAPGSLSAQGELHLDQAQTGAAAQLSCKLERLGVWQLPEQWLSLSGETQLSWQGGAAGSQLAGQGALSIDAGYWQLAPAGAPRLSDDVVVRRTADRAAPLLRPKLKLDLALDFGPNFLFEGAGLHSQLAGQIRLSADGRDLPRAQGSIQTRAGRFAAYGQSLEIERGNLNFQGLPDNPALDVRAMRRGLAVEAGVEVLGTAQKPRVRLVSEPELPDAEKLSWLILGHGPERVGSADASVLLAAAGDVLGQGAGNVVNQLKAHFGIDEFDLRQGQLGGSRRSTGSRVVSSGASEGGGVDQQILSVGKRLSNRASISYEQALGTAESLAKLSFSLTRELTLIGRVGSDNAIDLFYGTRWGGAPARQTKAPEAAPEAATARP